MKTLRELLTGYMRENDSEFSDDETPIAEDVLEDCLKQDFPVLHMSDVEEHCDGFICNRVCEVSGRFFKYTHFLTSTDEDNYDFEGIDNVVECRRDVVQDYRYRPLGQHG